MPAVVPISGDIELPISGDIGSLGSPVRWNLSTKGSNVTVGPDPRYVSISGAGTIMSAEGVTAGGGGEAFWEIAVAETGRGSWVGLVEVEEGGEEERGGGGGRRSRWPDGNLSLSAIGWAIWGGETGLFHPMYIKGKSIDQIVGLKAGQTVGLHLRRVASSSSSSSSSSVPPPPKSVTPPSASPSSPTFPSSPAAPLSDAAPPRPHVLAYYVDGQEVCEAFLPEELPQGLQGKTSTLHLAVSNGWAGVTRVSVTARAPPGVA